MLLNKDEILTRLDELTTEERAEFAKQDARARGPGSNRGWAATEWIRDERGPLVRALRVQGRAAAVARAAVAGARAGVDRVALAEAPEPDMVDHLAAALDAANARVTVDRGRNCTHPCTFCGKPPAAGDYHLLRTIGRYLDGDALTRPVCPKCLPLAKLRMTKKEGENV
jgi:hypothetical protein